MGDIHQPEPVLFLLAAFSRHAAALDWARQRAEAAWGPVALESPAFDFDETDYYEADDGPGLAKSVFCLRAAGRSGSTGRLKIADKRLGTGVC